MSVLCMIYLAWCGSRSRASTANSRVAKAAVLTAITISALCCPAKGRICGFDLLWFRVFPELFYIALNIYSRIFAFFFSPPDGILLKITSKQRKTDTHTKCFLSQTLGQHIHLSSLHKVLPIKDVIFPLCLYCTITRLTLSKCVELTFCECFQYTSKYHIIYQLWESVL